MGIVNPFAAYTGFYSKAEKLLEPYQIIVSALIVFIIIGSIWALFQKDPVKRTLWMLYMWLP